MAELFSSPKPPAPPKPPPRAPQIDQAAQAADQNMELRKRRGRWADMATSTTGDMTPLNIGTKTLLGQ